MITDIEPDLPFDYENKKSDVFRGHFISDLIFSTMNALETTLIFAYSLYNNSNSNFYVHLPSTNRIQELLNFNICPLNSLFLSFFKYCFNLSDQVLIACFGTLYSFLTMYLFRNMLYSLRLGRFTNALSFVLFIYPLEMHIQFIYVSREILLLIFIMYSIILYQQANFWLLTIIIFLSPFITEGGIILSVAYSISYLLEKKNIKAFFLSFLFILSFSLTRKIGFFNMMKNGLITRLMEESRLMLTHRQAECILQMIILPLLGCFNMFSISFAPSLITLFFIIKSLFKNNSTELASAIIPQVLSLVGYSYLMTPRVKIGVVISSLCFFYTFIDAA